MSVFVCVRVYMCVYVYVYMCLYTHIDTYLYAYVCVCMYFVLKEENIPEMMQRITATLTVWYEYSPAMVTIQ